ncbi:MAG: lmo0937 family membrane protein [Halorhodospira sp.]
MLVGIAVILLILWALGLFTGVTVGGFLHALLVIALIIVVVQLLSGRRIL